MKLKDVVSGWDARDLRGGIAGAVLLVIAAYFQSVSSYIISHIVDLAGSFSNAAVDFLYVNASGDPVSGNILFIVLAIMVMPTLIYTTLRKTDLTQGITQTRTSSSLTSSRMNAELELMGKSRLSRFLLKRSRAFLITLMAFVIIIIFSVGLTMASYIAFPIFLHDKFYKDIAAISPYISDHDRSLLISKWAMMRSHADYVLIESSLTNLAQSSGITLP